MGSCCSGSCLRSRRLPGGLCACSRRLWRNFHFHRCICRRSRRRSRSQSRSRIESGFLGVDQLGRRHQLGFQHLTEGGQRGVVGGVGVSLDHRQDGGGWCARSVGRLRQRNRPRHGIPKRFFFYLYRYRFERGV